MVKNARRCCAALSLGKSPGRNLLEKPAELKYPGERNLIRETQKWSCNF